tara:strand:+ start:516 stop:656 length:141 start_codon:yes stop_codon:yes gene_type:complete
MVCRAWITKDGERIYAKDYGKKAFCWFPSKETKAKAPTVVTADASA